MKTIPTVAELRKQGIPVEVNHKRLFFRYDPFNGKRKEKVVAWHEADNRKYFLSATGGETKVTIQTEQGDFTGVTECSIDDNFCKTIGCEKAMARALAQMKKYLKTSTLKF